jgi:hypothetical protein
MIWLRMEGIASGHFFHGGHTGGGHTTRDRTRAPAHMARSAKKVSTKNAMLDMSCQRAASHPGSDEYAREPLFAASIKKGRVQDSLARPLVTF